MPAAIPIAISTAMSVGATAIGPGAMTAQMFWTSAALGAAVGAIGMLAQGKQPKTNRATDDALQTTSIRNLPVAILFGRGRVQGNYVAMGAFHGFPTEAEDDHERYQVLHAVIGLCEGPVQAGGNLKVDGSPRSEYLNNDQEVPIRHGDWRSQFKWELVAGTNAQALPDIITDAGMWAGPTTGFTTLEPDGTTRKLVGTRAEPIPWRNTALLAVKTGVGLAPRLASYTLDMVGPDMTIRRSGSPGGTNFFCTPRYGFYDAHDEAFCCTVASSAGHAEPWGIVKISRTGAHGNQHTQPPEVMGDAAQFGWYLGRHDIVVFQHDTENDLFHVGYWGITPGSADWESHRPHRDYSEPILAQYLDEQHGILHTLHQKVGVRYVLRWNLLTGDVARIDTDLPAPGYKAFMYSPELDAYILATVSGSLILATPDGRTYVDSTAVNMGGCVGLCVSGGRVGVIKTDGFVYFDPVEGTVEALGTSTVGLTRGEMGGTISGHQNSATGHVTLTKQSAGDAAFVNFIPSCLEDPEDVSALGTPDENEFQWDAPAWAAGAVYAVGDYVRDTGGVDADFPEWEVGVFYAEGDLVSRGRSKYVCISGNFSEYLNSPGAPGLGRYWDVWAGNPAEEDQPTYKCIQANTGAPANRPGSAAGTAYWSPVETQQMPIPSPVSDWVRDWSYRTYNAYSLVSLEGNSSLAAAAWAAMVDEPTLDTRRWGGGFNADYFSLSSFEQVHAFCVGGVLMENRPSPNAAAWQSGAAYAANDYVVQADLRYRCLQAHTAAVGNTPGTSGGSAYWSRWHYAERYKFDYVLDSEQGVTDLVSSEILGACNGFRTMVGGKLQVGIQRTGMGALLQQAESEALAGAGADERAHLNPPRRPAPFGRRLEERGHRFDLEQNEACRPYFILRTSTDEPSRPRPRGRPRRIN